MSQTMMSVSSLNTKIKSLLEATFLHIFVEGEVASVTYHTSGHVYLSLQDKESSIKCVMWRSAAAKLKFRIEKGMHLVIEGSVSVYTPRGEYQLQVLHAEPYGKGALALAYEQLKERLKTKGYFDAHRKKPLPKYVQKLALVTAKESAALYDMLKIIEQRWPLLEVVIVDTLVQGEQAATQIAKALRYADSLDVDVVVVGRGGGSSEDLWCFNEEAVADAIFMMRKPVVSAVGHEVDVMISDFVADLRAPTPSAAMEMILPDAREIVYTLMQSSEQFSYSIEQKLQRLLRDLRHAEEMLWRSSPSKQLLVIQDKFVHTQEEFTKVIAYKLDRHASVLPQIQSNFRQAMAFIVEQKSQYVKFVEQKHLMNDPKLQCHKGWAQTSVEGKLVELRSLEINQKFILQDASTRIEALCLAKT